MKRIFFIVSILLASTPALAIDTRCPGVQIEADPKGPAAAAIYGHLTLRPSFMDQYSEKVQLFITYHECAHAQGLALGSRRIKDDEIKADHIAFDRAYAEGWIDQRAVDALCESFGTDRESRTHPSAKKRCAQLRGWFAAAEKGKKR